MALAKKTTPKRRTTSASLRKKQKRPVDWRVDDRPVAYDRAVAFMEAKANLIREKGDQDYVWLLEHPPVYTAGTSADPDDLLDPRFPVYNAGRGGEYTYHGPGQRVAYVMMDLQKRHAAAGPDLRAYVYDLEEWVIETLKVFDVTGERRRGRVGIWVNLRQHGIKVPRGASTESKIAAIGVRVRKWVTYHGVSINLNPDLTHFEGIVPCGIREHGVTSLADLGIKATMKDLDHALRQSWDKIF